MKKICLILLSVIMLLSLGACNLKVETIDPSPAPAVETAKAEESIEPAAEVTAELWELAAGKNEYSALLEYFGTSLRDYGAELELGSDGSFKWYAGASGGAGMWSENNGLIEARFTSYNDPHEETVTLSRLELEGEEYLSMHLGDFSIYWRHKSEPVIPDGEEIYMDILEKYALAMTEQWDIDKLYDENINPLIRYLYSEGSPLEKTGYVFRDINGDKIPELFIVSADGTSVYDIYTALSLTYEPVLLSQSGERYSSRLCRDGSIFYEGSGSAYEHYFVLYKLENGALVELDSITANYMENEQEPYFRNGEKISNAEAEALIAEYGADLVVFDGVKLFSQR